MSLARRLPSSLIRSSLVSQAAYSNAYRSGMHHSSMSPFLRSRGRGRCFQPEFKLHFRSRRRFLSTSTSSLFSATTDDTSESKAHEKQHEDHAVQFKELHEQIDDLTDRYKRSLAENENLRNRLNHKIEEARMYGIQSFCKDLLDVSDVLSKAIETSGETNLADLLEGLKLTERELQQVFHRHGLEPENPMGVKFDPHKHEALFQIPDQTVDHGTVVQVQKIGYLLHGRTVRPALVAVSKK